MGQGAVASIPSNLPHDIRLIAAGSRLIDIHQSRRESGGAYVPDVPEKAGFNLFLALQIIEALHEIEVDRGIGFCPISELVGRICKRLPIATEADIEDAIANLRHGREIHYGCTNDQGEITFARTWDSTPLVDVQEGFSQIQLTENARLLLRISSLRESWLYSDLDADKLVKAIERAQFQDIPALCRGMNLDLASKSKQLSEILERPSLAELRSLLIAEGANISLSLNSAATTITQAIDLVFNDHIQSQFEAKKATLNFSLGNLQADLELVLQNVESLSRRFLRFIGRAQQVRHEGGQAIHFLKIAHELISKGDEVSIRRSESLLCDLLPWGLEVRHFHPSMLIGEADLKPAAQESMALSQGYTVDPSHPSGTNRFVDFVHRNRDLVIQNLQAGPLTFSEMMAITGFVLEPGETPLDFFGVYAAPGLLNSDTHRIVVGMTDAIAQFNHVNRDVAASDPIMYLEENDDPS